MEILIREDAKVTSVAVAQLIPKKRGDKLACVLGPAIGRTSADRARWFKFLSWNIPAVLALLRNDAGMVGPPCSPLGSQCRIDS
ncbi:MAG: hypothetical protein INR62_05380 [Rhodospirillales bacterium]|nr:hypothetical protein [Acetobacter sp.]